MRVCKRVRREKLNSFIQGEILIRFVFYENNRLVVNFNSIRLKLDKSVVV